MGRVKISEPERYIFSALYSIRVTDLNYGNHLANEQVLVIAQEVRMSWLRTREMSELDFFGVSLIQGDAELVYQSEGFYADEIRIEMGVDDLSNSSFDFVYKMTNLTTGKPLALVKTRMVCFDYSNRKVQPIPEAFRLTVQD